MAGFEKLSFEQLKEWTPEGTVVAFIGEEAELHAYIHRMVMNALKKERTELSDWKSVIVEANESNLAQTLKILHGKHVWGIIFTSPLKSTALRIISPSFQDERRGEITATEDMTVGLGSAEALADRVGAIDLALWKPRGYWGLSTDGTAFTLSFFDSFKTNLKTKVVVIVGCESFGRAVAVEALSRGAKEVWIGGAKQEAA